MKFTFTILETCFNFVKYNQKIRTNTLALLLKKVYIA